MMRDESSLLLLQAGSLGGLNSLRESIDLLKVTFPNAQFSSIYKEKDSSRRSSYDGKLFCVTKVEAAVTLAEFAAIVDSVISTQSFPAVSVTLLSHRNEVELLPSRAVPHPYLHSHAAVAFCVLEVSPGFFHPVYKKSLTELVRTLIPRSSAEFISLGR